jgi:GTP:adenosylcobinamide-phosphate guanylyltransferase
VRAALAVPENNKPKLSMKIIVPMAGRGSRLRPHTLTVPKPLIPIAGKPIVQRLVEDIVSVCGDKKVDEIAFIIGDFGDQVEADLKKVAENLGAKGSIYYQDKPLGTAHAIHCAADSMDDEIVVAFADTLFRADFTLDTEADSVIWVKQVEDPSAFGVVQFAEDGTINNFVEKPTRVRIGFGHHRYLLLQGRSGVAQGIEIHPRQQHYGQGRIPINRRLELPAQARQGIQAWHCKRLDGLRKQGHHRGDQLQNVGLPRGQS